jgi:myo-inositol-1(or 4)-monophosphatase
VAIDQLALLHEVADAVQTALTSVSDMGPSGRRDGQYQLDLVADEAGLGVLRAAGVGVLSEESGLEGADRDIVVVIDPVDGSTNFSRRVPWYATALCAVDADGPSTALVVNLASGVRYSARRGEGAFRDGQPIRASGCTVVGESLVGLNGLPPAPLGYAQSRVFGAVALDLCLVAEGVLDGFVDCVDSAHGIWDYAASVLICREAGAVVVDLDDRDLYELNPAMRRTPVAAATAELLTDLLSARRHPA